VCVCVCVCVCVFEREDKEDGARMRDNGSTSEEGEALGWESQFDSWLPAFALCALAGIYLSFLEADHIVLMPSVT
jgi:hypothetical protein